MKLEQVAAITYTIRDFCKTPADVAVSMKKIREIGYPAIQASGMGPIAEEELVKILDGEGLTCCATHEPGPKILDEPQAIIERLGKLGCKYTAYPYPGGVEFNSIDDAKALAARLNRAGQALHEAGMTLCYHNHAIEFRRFENRTLLDIFYSETDPRHLQGEPDTHWIQAGGGDPVAWCERLAGRLPLLHMKDYAIDAENKPTFAEIGHGNLDWPRIVAAAKASGCEWYIVEQDRCDGDPFDSLKMSFDYITGNLLD